MKNTSDTLIRLLGQIFDEARNIRNRTAHAQRRADFVFHMTDWQKDLERLAGLYCEPKRFPFNEARDIVAAVLYHATGHLIAAARLYDYVPDPFSRSERKPRNAPERARGGRPKRLRTRSRL